MAMTTKSASATWATVPAEHPSQFVDHLGQCVRAATIAEDDRNSRRHSACGDGMSHSSRSDDSNFGEHVDLFSVRSQIHASAFCITQSITENGCNCSPTRRQVVVYQTVNNSHGLAHSGVRRGVAG